MTLIRPIIKILFLVSISSFTIFSCQEKYDPSKYSDVIVTDDDVDMIFVKFDDSLRMYFGELEIDLLKQYKRNHEHIKTVNDFASFYRKSSTLRDALLRNLNESTEHHIKRGRKNMYHLYWFDKLALGLDITLTKDGKNYGVYFKYDDWLDHTKITEGKADDEFVRLLQAVYSRESPLPKWYSMVGMKHACSNLGTGLHFEVLSKIDNIKEQTSLFNKELRKVKTGLISDILFKKDYCVSKKKVMTELEKITTKIKLDEKELKRIKDRMEKLKIEDSIVYDCLTGNCY